MEGGGGAVVFAVVKALLSLEGSRRDSLSEGCLYLLHVQCPMYSVGLLFMAL